MIDLTTARREPGSSRTMKIVGIGGAGGNTLDRMALDGISPATLIALNTDTRALTASVAGTKIQLGCNATRGLGTGGDPELGRMAAEEAREEIRAELAELDAVFLLAGLGGGTGSGAIPIIAEAAREAGALVIAVVTLPFAFEGKRRGAQASEALCELGRHADLIVCFENDRMSDSVSPSAGIAQAFSTADQTLAQSIASMSALLSRRGLIHLGFDDFKAALQSVQARALFGHGEADGNNRPFDALARALRNPLMDKGRLLRDCDTVLVQVTGGPDMTLNEVQLLMEELNRHVDDQARLLFGTAVDPALSGRLTVTIFSSLALEQPRKAAPRPVPKAREPEPAAQTMPIPVPVPTPAPVIPAAPEPPPAPPEQEEEPQPPEPSPAPLAPPAPPYDEIAAGETLPPPEMPVMEPVEDFAEAPEAWEETAIPEPGEPAQEPEEQGESEEPQEQTAQASLFAEEAEPVAEPEPEAPRQPPASAKPARPEPEKTRNPFASFLKPRTPQPPSEPEEEPAEEIEEIVEAEEETEPAAAAPAPEPPPEAEPEPAPAPRKKPTPPAPPAKAPTQETLKFEPVTRGRFEKSEPTIVDGQDLDVPAYLRHNIRIRP